MSYWIGLRRCEVSTRAVGALRGVADETTAEISTPMKAAEMRPARVSPYAHNTRAHGQVRGLRKSRPKESSSSFRKSSVIGFGATALHNSQRSHTATDISSRPHQRLNATLSTPAWYA